MIKTIYKYEVQIGENTLDLPMFSIVVHTAIQNNKFFIWVMQEPESDIKQTRTFYILETGMKFNFDVIYIGTVSPDNYTLVYHVIEIIK